MHSGTEKHVKLKEKIPVYLGYWTARVRPDGTLQFRKDVYGTDTRQMALLKDRLQRLKKSSQAATSATTVQDATQATDGKPVRTKATKTKGRPASR
jgi:hypothetical protein